MNYGNRPTFKDRIIKVGNLLSHRSRIWPPWNTFNRSNFVISHDSLISIEKSWSPASTSIFHSDCDVWRWLALFLWCWSVTVGCHQACLILLPVNSPERDIFATFITSNKLFRAKNFEASIFSTQSARNLLQTVEILRHLTAAPPCSKKCEHETSNDADKWDKININYLAYGWHVIFSRGSFVIFAILFLSFAHK